MNYLILLCFIAVTGFAQTPFSIGGTSRFLNGGTTTFVPPPASGGGGGTYYYAETLANGNTQGSYFQNVFYVPVTVVNGTADSMSFWVTNYSAPFNAKMGVYANTIPGGALLATGTVSITGNGWATLTFGTPFSVSSGSYILSQTIDTSGNGNYIYNNAGQTINYAAGAVYASELQSTIPVGTTSQPSFGIVCRIHLQ